MPTLQLFSKTYFKFTHENLKNGPQKLLIISSNLFFHSPAQPTAQSPKSIFHIINICLFYLWCSSAEMTSTLFWSFNQEIITIFTLLFNPINWGKNCLEKKFKWLTQKNWVFHSYLYGRQAVQNKHWKRLKWKSDKVYTCIYTHISNCFWNPSLGKEGNLYYWIYNFG